MNTDRDNMESRAINNNINSIEKKVYNSEKNRESMKGTQLLTMPNVEEFKIEQYTPTNFVITLTSGKSFFMSYGLLIAVIDESGIVTLDSENWQTSKTTGRYRNQFLESTRDETKDNIKSGLFKLDNLNILK